MGVARAGHGQLSQGYRIERRADRIAHGNPKVVDIAETGPFAYSRVGRVFTGADHRRERALERSEHLAHPDLLGRPTELVAAVRATGTVHQAGFAQADHELLEVGPRQPFVVGHLGQADWPVAVVTGKLHHQPRPVFAARREMDRARPGEDAPRPLDGVTADRGLYQRDRRIPSYHVRIESRPGLERVQLGGGPSAP